jgi:hypothetical protein
MFSLNCPNMDGECVAGSCTRLSASCRTDHDGRCVQDGVIASSVEIYSEYDFAKPKVVRVQPPQHATADFVFSRHGAIHGRVLREDGQPSSPRTVVLYVEGEGVTQRARTDALGRFVFQNLPAGRFRLDVTEEGWTEQKREVLLTLTDGQRVSDLIIRVPNESDRIAGRVVDATGGPVANALVTYRYETGTISRWPIDGERWTTANSCSTGSHPAGDTMSQRSDR